VRNDWLIQSRNQMQVSEGFPVIWVFAQKGGEDFARKLFDGARDGQKRILTTTISRVGASR
jgi:hypothetical protein